MVRTLTPLILLLAACAASRAEPVLRDGDIIFQTSKSSQSLAVQSATRSPYSHMGMVLHRDGKPFVFEASATVRFTPVISPAAMFDSPLLELVVN